MKLCVIGTGYVGLVTGTCLAEMGNQVICVDVDPTKIDALRQGEVPIYEPGLDELIQTNTREGRLHFTTDLPWAVQESLVCFIAVGTPPREDGSADLTAVFNVATSIARAMPDYRVIVTKSTVPVGTSEQVGKLIAENTNTPFSIVSNPEFLKQGAAVDDCLKPDRVVVGTNDQRASDIMQELYSPFLRTGNPIILMDIPSAEMTKYVANAFLATKISFINEMSKLCEQVGADISQVRTGISTDSRIGGQFLFPGIGFGGSCFPKDIKALIKTSQEFGCPSQILQAVDQVNQDQRDFFLDKVYRRFGNDLSGKTFAVWGLAFKPRTDDLREAPSVTVIEALLARGASVQAYDPKAMPNAKTLFDTRVTFADTAYEALNQADAMLLITEWNEFRRPDFDQMKQRMKASVIIDGRNQYDPERMLRRGFEYQAMGLLIPSDSSVDSLSSGIGV